MTAMKAMAMTDSELRTICFSALVYRVGYLGAERFVVMMNREPQDYTEWRKNQFEDDGETIEELGEKIRRYSESRRGKSVSA